jgi:hypothetical protein
MLGPNREDVLKWHRKLRNEETRNLYSSSNNGVLFKEQETSHKYKKQRKVIIFYKETFKNEMEW